MSKLQLIKWQFYNFVQLAIAEKYFILKIYFKIYCDMSRLLTSSEHYYLPFTIYHLYFAVNLSVRYQQEHEIVL